MLATFMCNNKTFDAFKTFLNFFPSFRNIFISFDIFIVQYKLNYLDTINKIRGCDRFIVFTSIDLPRKLIEQLCL